MAHDPVQDRHRDVHEPAQVERRGHHHQAAQRPALGEREREHAAEREPERVHPFVSLGERVVRRHDRVDPARARQPLQLGVDRAVAGQERALAVEAGLGQRLGRRPHLVRRAGEAVHAQDRGREPAARVAEPEGRGVDASRELVLGASLRRPGHGRDRHAVAARRARARLVLGLHPPAAVGCARELHANRPIRSGDRAACRAPAPAAARAGPGRRARSSPRARAARAGRRRGSARARAGAAPASPSS